MSAHNWKFTAAKLSKVQELNLPDLEQGYTIAWFGRSAFETLAKSWKEGQGAFIFLKTRWNEVDPKTLTAKLNAFFQQPVRQDISFLWIDNPLEAVLHWKTNSIASTRTTDNTQLSRLTYLDLRNYSLSLAQATTIVLKENAFEFQRNTGDDRAFEWSSSYGTHRFYGLGDAVRLPMQGDQAGCLQFELSVKKQGTKTGTFGYPGLRDLDVGMRIFFRDPNFPETGDAFYLASHRYPILQEQSQYDEAYPFFPDTITWQVCLDLVYPQDRRRSYFEFNNPKAPNQASGLPSAFRTNSGYTVHLFPKAGNSRLVFTPRPVTLGEEDENKAPFYLSPTGKYEIKIPKYSPGEARVFLERANVIGGISGLEYIKIGTGFEIEFIPGMPGYASSFLSIDALLRDFNLIQRQFQRSVWSDPEKPGDKPTGGTPKDLPESFDIDWEIETTDGLNISDEGRLAMLDLILQDYFPSDFRINEIQRENYVSIPIVEDWIQWFRDKLKEATLLLAGSGSLLSHEVSTSWAYITGNPNAVYFAQPDNAALHMAERSSSDFLDYMEVPAMGLPSAISETTKLEELTGSTLPAFPLLPYGQVDAGSLTDIRQLEMLVINPTRRKRIHQIGQAEAFATALSTGAGDNRLGTTPQGLVARFSDDWKTISELQLAKDTKGKQISFVDIPHGSPMKSALQSNQLFLVISDPQAVMDYFSNEKLKDLPVENDLDILDWVFELGPGYWDKNGTIMVFKYTDTSLLEMTAQPERWFMPEEFNLNKENTSNDLQQLLAQAIELGTGSDPKARRKYEALATAATQPNWTGILLLNVHVPLRGLPDSLKALAGGMNPDLFYAQYLGIEVTQVKTKGSGEQIGLDPQVSSIMALIDYENPEVPAADPSGYNFHVLSLSIVFQNSSITHFAAEVYLIMDKIFDERARLLNSSTNIISLRGVAEEHNGRITYSFGFSGANRFLMSGKVLEEVEVMKVQFSTDPLPPKDQREQVLKITGRFTLWGGVRFAYLQDFDLLSFGRPPGVLPSAGDMPAAAETPPDSLRISNLEITMTFGLDTKTNQVSNLTDASGKTIPKFRFLPGNVAVDMVKSGWRKQSVFEQFPLTFRGFVNVQTAAGAEVKTGHMPVSAPLRRAKLGANYYAMKFDLKLGSLGALSGSKPLIVGILAAWNPGEEGLFIGLKLPGSSGDKKEIIIQGILKLTFRSIRFVVFDKPSVPDNSPERRVGYLLNLKNIKLTFFMLSFPPIGQTELTLFGDPRKDIERADRLIGWYAAYVKN